MLRVPDPVALLQPILAIHARIRAAVLDASTQRPPGELQRVAADGEGDTIYAIDRVSEAVLIDGLEEIAVDAPIRLVAEGMPGGGVTLPRGTAEADCVWRLLVDPIDGTRGLMYQKRSAWILTGVAPNRGPGTRLRDIVLAVQTEIPLVKQHLSDQLWAFRGAGVSARRRNRLTGEEEPLALAPSSAATIAHGYASVVRFFPGARDVLSAIDDELAEGLLPRAAPGKATSFEDQYASTGGQLYELMAGHDRFIADLRPLVGGIRAERGLPSGLCCHPYDLCTALIAEELGVIVTGLDGASLDAPLDLETDVAWIGYANQRLRAVVEPVLRHALRRRGLISA
jgi:fructose-1,6-bisphosphatase/inositol monophosphatase family enzyme